jgi:hypothetical protein
MAEKAERVTIKVKQRGRNLRIYYVDDMLLSVGDTDVISRGDDLEYFDMLTPLGQKLASRLVNYPGIDVIDLNNYELQVCKGEMFSWTGRHDLDRVVMFEIMRAIGEELESAFAEVAALTGEEAGDIHVEIRFTGDPPNDFDSWPVTDEDEDEETGSEDEAADSEDEPTEEQGPLAA